MIKYLHIFLFTTLITSVISCKTDTKTEETYFGGKIIHPKSNYVVLFSMDQVIDTFYLDNEDKFIGKLKSAKEGLYYFSHGFENQHIYLKPNDSLMLRLNTWDFDESLVFAGKGAERNNILIDCFLEDEKEAKSLYAFNKLQPNDFKMKFDSLLVVKMKMYDEYIANHPEETEGFKNLLKVALTYPLYSRAEKYPMLYAKYSETEIKPTIDASFFNYRSFVKIDSDSLIYYPPYSQYVRNYLYNETYSLGHPPMKKNYTSKFTTDLLTIIGKKVSSENTKNAFLKQTLVSHFYNKSSCDINQEPFDKFFELSTNEEDRELINKLVNDTKAIIINERLQNFTVKNYNHASKSIYDIIGGKNAVLFFWNPEYVSESYIVSRLNYLSNNYQNITFIPIRIDGEKSERIEKLDIKGQFYLSADSEANKFLSCKMPRSIIVNKQGKVMNGYASISSLNVTDYLETVNKLN